MATITIFEAVHAMAGYTPPDANITKLAIMNVEGLGDPDEAYAKEKSSLVTKAAISVLIALKGLTSWQEGQLAESYNADALNEKIGLLAQQAGIANPLEEGQPTITPLHFW